MKRRHVFLWLQLLFFPTGASAQELQAGVSAVEITPPAGIEMWGAAGRKEFAQSALDPLYAKTLVLKSSEVTVAVVVLDLGRTFSREQMDRVRQSVRHSAGIEHVIFSATHTHTGPNILDDRYISKRQERWEPDALDRIVSGIERARRSAVPARIGVGLGASYIGHNRQDGPVRILGQNLAGVRTSPQDPIVTVIRIDRLNGEPIAILAHYACHPVILNHVPQYSADFPGAMAEYVEQRHKGAICFFLQGACGDINSDHVAVGGLTIEKKKAGYALGRVVDTVSRGIVTRLSQAGSLQIVEDELTFENRWDTSALKTMGAVPTYYQWLTTGRPIGYPPESVRAPVTTMLVNRSLAFITMPGEPYTDLQIDLRERLPGVSSVLLGYANGYLGYLPTLRAATRDGVFYGANAWPTVVAVGAPERMLDRGIIRILEFLGKLKTTEDGPASGQ